MSTKIYRVIFSKDGHANYASERVSASDALDAITKARRLNKAIEGLRPETVELLAETDR